MNFLRVISLTIMAGVFLTLLFSMGSQYNKSPEIDFKNGVHYWYTIHQQLVFGCRI